MREVAVDDHRNAGLSRRSHQRVYSLIERDIGTSIDCDSVGICRRLGAVGCRVQYLEKMARYIRNE